MCRLSVVVPLFLCSASAFGQASPQKSIPQAIPPADQYPGGRHPAVQPLTYQLVPMTTPWQPAVAYQPAATMAVQAVPMQPAMVAVQPAAFALPTLPTLPALPACRPLVIGPGPIATTLGWIGRQLAPMGTRALVIQRVPVSAAPVAAVNYQFVPAQVPTQPAPAASREAAPPPPIIPSAQNQASVWPPSRNEF